MLLAIIIVYQQHHPNTMLTMKIKIKVITMNEWQLIDCSRVTTIISTEIVSVAYTTVHFAVNREKEKK